MPMARSGVGFLAMMAAMGAMPEIGKPYTQSAPQSEEDKQAKLKLAQDKRDRRNEKRRLREVKDAKG